MAHEKNLEWSAYIDYYGAFLTEKQLAVMTAYYNEDMSLAEIAAETGVSRQGVRDAIQHAEKKLADLENKLHLVMSREG